MQRQIKQRIVAIIHAVLEYCGDKEPQWLSELTHKEDTWKSARHGCPPGGNCNIIEKESMQSYYGGLV